MIYLPMKEEMIISALQSKIKEKDMDIPETVHFNDGMITAIEEVKRQYRLEQIERKRKQHSVKSWMPYMNRRRLRKYLSHQLPGSATKSPARIVKSALRSVAGLG
jgi:hypothetical protein